MTNGTAHLIVLPGNRRQLRGEIGPLDSERD